MKDDEIAVSFSMSFIRDRLTLPSTEGGSYDLFIIEMPDQSDPYAAIKLAADNMKALGFAHTF